MCYLLTYEHSLAEPLEQMEEFKARADAERRVHALIGVSQVSNIRLWKLAATPVIKQQVVWEDVK